LIAHIAAQRAEHNIPIRVSCKALGMSESWYYKHHNHPEAARSARHRRLVAAVGKSFHASDGTYGSPRVVVDLWEAGWQVSVNTVAAIMAEHGWVARPRRVRRSLTKQGKRPAYPDLVGRKFTVDRPDQVWVGDVTLIRTLEGPLYAATVIDLFARRMLALATSTHHDAELSCGALKMAIAARGGNVRGVIWHTDRGSEYTAQDMHTLCWKFGISQSMGRVGSALDNSVAESANSTLKMELVYRTVFRTRDEARIALAGYVWKYNHTRRHSHCGQVSPIRYEQYYTATHELAAA
jgi:transposase InsO family protein